MNKLTQDHINDLYDRSRKQWNHAFSKATILTIQLPNGFVLTEMSACVDPANYDEQIGCTICEQRIKSKIWELEGYRLQCDLNLSNKELMGD